MAVMQRFLVIILMVCCFTLVGCLQTVLSVILAPESVIASAADSVARSGAQTLSDSGLNEESMKAVNDIDRLLKEYPNADNATRLRALKEQLERDASLQPGGMENGAKRLLARQVGDTLLINPPGDAAVPRRTSNPRPSVLPAGRSLIPEAEPDHLLLLEPIRVN